MQSIQLVGPWFFGNALYQCCATSFSSSICGRWMCLGYKLAYKHPIGKHELILDVLVHMLLLYSSYVAHSIHQSTRFITSCVWPQSARFRLFWTQAAIDSIIYDALIDFECVCVPTAMEFSLGVVEWHSSCNAQPCLRVDQTLIELWLNSTPWSLDQKQFFVVNHKEDQLVSGVIEN